MIKRGEGNPAYEASHLDLAFSHTFHYVEVLYRPVGVKICRICTIVYRLLIFWQRMDFIDGMNRQIFMGYICTDTSQILFTFLVRQSLCGLPRRDTFSGLSWLFWYSGVDKGIFFLSSYLICVVSIFSGIWYWCKVYRNQQGSLLLLNMELM